MAYKQILHLAGVLFVILVYGARSEISIYDRDASDTASDPDNVDSSQMIEVLKTLKRTLHMIREQRNNNKIGLEIEKWLNKNDVELGKKLNKEIIADWNYMTNITDENSKKKTEASVEEAKWVSSKIEEARGYLQYVNQLTNQTATRELKYWVYSNYPHPKDPKDLEKLTELKNELTTIYGKAELHKNGKVYRMEPELTELMSKSRDYDELLWAWKGWRDVTGPKMKSSYTEAIKIMNEAATEHGFEDYGQAWRIANYEKDNIEPMVDKLYEDILPLYKELHAYVRKKLMAKYGADKVKPKEPIPAHLLGNMWSQEWNIDDLVTPFPDVPSTDVTPTMVAKGYTPEKMFKLAEKFFTSIGLEPMVKTFWEKSMIVRPNDGREVQCHASAEDFMDGKDFRIKMCAKVTQDYLQTIHHEMGHIEYFMQYRHQPIIFRSGANSAFHEAIGDTIALSVMTPKHLKAIDLLKEEDSGKTDAEKRRINFLMSMALRKIAFLPFGYLMDKWRWDVFRGKITESDYNAKWWEYRVKYQGVAPPVPRTEADFDPGAKYHIAAFVPYIRYFLSFLGQFQFQRALCDAAGQTGPLDDCDIYQSTDAGTLLKSALHLGCSKPWPEVMEILTGQQKFSSSAIYDYFKPLYDWLKTQNKPEDLGW